MRPDPVVQRHLLGIAAALREETPPLAGEVAARRAAVLDHLEEYALAGKYPKNTVGVRHPKAPVPRGFAHAYEERAPLFVDHEGTHCAVGALVAATRPDVVAEVQARCNDAWIREMLVPALAAWAKDNGFTLDEVARIQPSYGPAFVYRCEDIPPPPEEMEGVVTDGLEDAVDVMPSRYSPHYCFDGCRGVLNVWIAIENRGGLDATGVHVEASAWDGDSSLVLDDVSVRAGMSTVIGPIQFANDAASAAEVQVQATVEADADTGNDATFTLGPRGLDGTVECARPCGCDQPRSGNALAASFGALVLAAQRRRSRGARA